MKHANLCNHGRAYKLIGVTDDPQLALSDGKRATVTFWCPDCGSLFVNGKAWLMPREVAMTGHSSRRITK